MAACTSQSANANRAAPPLAPKQVSVPPAAAAGGACQLLDWAMIKSSLGLTFAVAAAAQQGDTYTCVTQGRGASLDRKSTRLNSSHMSISYAVFCLKKKKNTRHMNKC